MSYDINLVDQDGDTIILDIAHHLMGGTHALGGTKEAWLNITYNYADHFYRVLGEKGIRSVYGKTGAEAAPILRAAAKQLGGVMGKGSDYWAPTKGNAAAALLDLAELCGLAPEGIVQGD